MRAAKFNVAVCISLLSTGIALAASPEVPDLRLYGATPVLPGDDSYFVNVNGCGGTLIAPEWVLTAKHCLPFAQVGSSVYPGWKRDDTSVGVVTRHVLAQVEMPGSLDIGLLKIEPVTNIRPLPLAAVTPLPNQPTRIVGRGEGSPGGLGTADFTLVSTGANPTWLMKGANLDIRACYGDSGSPQLMATAGGLRLIGVVYSTVGLECQRGAQHYGVNVTYPEALNWITSQTGVTPGPQARLIGSLPDSQTQDASLAGDSNPSTYWAPPSGQPSKMATVVIDRTTSQAEVPVNTLTYLPQQDSRAGDVTIFAIVISHDGKTFYEVANGEWPSSKDSKTITWTGFDNTRYVGLVAYGTNGGSATFAELTTAWTPPMAEQIPTGGLAVAASSRQSGHPAKYATDGNSGTFWHSQWTPQAPLPQSITVQTTKSTRNLTYLPRQDGSLNGIFTRYYVYGSNDGVNWATVQSGVWPLNGSLKTTDPFSPTHQNYPYYRLQAIDGSGGYASSAEIATVSNSTNNASAAP